MAKKILVIEDEPELLDLVSGSLMRAGYEVAVCDNGRQAVATAAAVKPDLIVMDVMLPGVDGLAIATQLAANDKLSSIPIIVTTALEQSRPMFEKIPSVRHFTTKPFTLAELLKTVASILH